MGILAELYREKGMVFPEGKIILMDGRTLDCYSKVEEEEAEEDEEQSELFINNAFFFLAHGERILSDSRMFLCRVDIRNGLVYTGTSGFTNPTLGVYIEWWLNCEGSMQADKKGRRTLVYCLAGSPLSGGNHCGAIREDGKRKTVTLTPFSNYWPCFMKINNRYTEVKCKYQTYGLKQVLDILKQEDNGNTDHALLRRSDGRFYSFINKFFSKRKV